MNKRDESKPRVSSLIGFLYAEELAAIPAPILEAASIRGTEKHAIIEDNHGKKSENIISNMFTEGLNMIFKESDLLEKPTFEEQLNGKFYTGKPDFHLGDTVLDYKFSIDLRPVTALQLILYGMLINEIHGTDIDRFFAFHFPKDEGLFIHKIPESARGPLMRYAFYIVENHEAIKAGEVERYEAILKWNKLLQDHTVFEPVGAVLPPMTITNDEEAASAAVVYYNIKKVTDYEKKLKAELKRYMADTSMTKIGDESGYGVQLVNGTRKTYDTIPTEVKEQYRKGTINTVTLKRFAPRAKKAKQVK